MQFFLDKIIVNVNISSLYVFKNKKKDILLGFFNFYLDNGSELFFTLGCYLSIVLWYTKINYEAFLQLWS